jgi:predicted membrane protein
LPLNKLAPHIFVQVVSFDVVKINFLAVLFKLVSAYRESHHRHVVMYTSRIIMYVSSYFILFYFIEPYTSILVVTNRGCLLSNLAFGDEKRKINETHFCAEVIEMQAIRGYQFEMADRYVKTKHNRCGCL